MIQEPSQKSLTPLLEQIKNKISIIEIIGQDVLLRKVGKNYSGLCPFHSERTPSFTVNEEKGLYHCYGCKAGGDLVSYVKETHGMSFLEAVEFLAEQAGLQSELKKSGVAKPAEAQLFQKQKLAFKLNRFVSLFYRESLEQNENVQNYLSQRGIDSEISKAFYIGYAEESWDKLCQYLSQKKAPLELGLELGLFQKSKKAAHENVQPYFDTFRNRVLFPILDTKGHVVGFGGRLIPLPSEEPALSISQPKYMNSPESFIYKKAEVLFGIYQAKKHIREQNEAIIVEGFFDVVGMHQAGFLQTVATCGTALSLSHLKQLKRFCEKIIILFDGDEAGQNAILKAMEIGLQNNIILYGAFLPEGKDPHDLSLHKEGQTFLKSALADAQPLLDSIIEKELSRENHHSEEEKSKSLRKILSWLQMYPDPIGKEFRVNRIAELTGLRTQALFNELKMKQSPLVNEPSFPIRKQNPPRVAMRQGNAVKKIMETWEFLLLKSQVHLKALDLFWDEVSSYFPKEMTKTDIFENELPKKLTLGADSIISKDPEKIMDLSAWEAWVLQEFVHEKHAQVLSIIRELLLTTGGVLSESQVRGTFQIGLLKLWARFSQTLKHELRDSESRVDLAAHSRLMKEYLDVQRKMKECINFYVNDQGN